MNFADGHIYHLDGQTCFNIKSVLKQTTTLDFRIWGRKLRKHFGVLSWSANSLL